jgi:hypothetical protein
VSEIPPFILDVIGWGGVALIIGLHMLLIRGSIKVESPAYYTNVLISIGMILTPVLMRATLTSGLLLLAGFAMIGFGVLQWWRSLK